MQVPTDEENRNTVAEAEKHFVCASDTEGLVTSIRAATDTMDEKYQNLGLAFLRNIAATAAVVTIPFTLARTSVFNAHFNRFHAAERIRALKIDYEAIPSGEETIEQAKERQASEIASRVFDDFVDSKDGQSICVRDSCKFLIDSAKYLRLSDAADELTRQGCVLLWGAIEVLCRDSFVAYLNSHPEAAKRLLAQPDLRKRFEMQHLSFETLLDHNFDLSGHMGTALSRGQDLTDLEIIKQVFDTLFPDTTAIRDSFRDKRMWILYQQRHLIVHKRAVVDTTYVKKTESALTVGEQLHISPAEFEANLHLTVEAGASILRSLPQRERAS